jgi:hypothetical protein
VGAFVRNRLSRAGLLAAVTAPVFAGALALVPAVRAHVSCDAQIDVTADGPVDVTLAGCEGRRGEAAPGNGRGHAYGRCKEQGRD